MPWIKIQNTLVDDPAVAAMATRLRMAEQHVVGCLVAVWSWADNQTADGFVQHATAALIDRRAAKKGFAEAMLCVGWLRIEAGGVHFPKWDRHNGESAKARAGEAEAKRLSRAGRSRNAPGLVVPSAPAAPEMSGHLSGQKGDTCPDVCPDQRRGEERREEDIQSQSLPKAPAVGHDRAEGEQSRLNEAPALNLETAPATDPTPAAQAEAIYAVYPRKAGRGDALKAIAKALKIQPADRLLAAVHAYAQAVATWPEGERQFIPHPATWFNGERYADDPATWARTTTTKNQPRPLSTDMTHEELTKRHGGSF